MDNKLTNQPYFILMN